MKTEIVSAQVGEKWLAFKQGADLSDLNPAMLQTWSIEHGPCNTGTLIQTGEKIGVKGDSPAYGLAYNLAFAEVHIQSVAGPLSQEKADRAFLETLPSPILAAFVGRTDSSRGLTAEEYETLLAKKPEPAPEETSAEVNVPAEDLGPVAEKAGENSDSAQVSS